MTTERLFQLAAILNIPISFMFSGLPNQTMVGIMRRMLGEKQE